MAVQLSALRVETSLDASGYKRGADAKVSADAAMVAAMQQCVAQQAAYTDALTKHTASLAQVRQANDNYKASLAGVVSGDSAASDAHEKHGVTLGHLVSGYLIAARVMREFPAAAAAVTGAVAGGLAQAAAGIGAASVAAKGFSSENAALQTAVNRSGLALGVLGSATGVAGREVGKLSEAQAAAAAGTATWAQRLQVAFPIMGRLLGLLGPVAAAVVVLSLVLGKASADFDRLVQLGERSQSLNIGVGFIQGFEKIAASARLAGDEMGKALDRAAGFVRDEFGQANKLLTLLDQIEKATGQNLGSKAFASTPSNEEDRIRVAVDAMAKLEAAGERLAALKIADSVFGPEVAERLRTGQASFAEMAAKVHDIAATDPMDQAKVDRALALNQAIADTKQQISDALSVSVDMSGVHSAILSAWLSILQAVRTVVGWFNTGLEYLNAWDQKIQSFGKALGGGMLADAVRGALNLGNNTLGTAGDAPLTVNVRGGRSIPNPLDPGPAKQAAKAAQDLTDEYDRVVKRTEDAIRKQQEAIDTYGMAAGAAAKYRTELELMTAATRAGREITPELKAQISAFGDQAAAAADKLDLLQKKRELLNDFSSAFTTFAKSIAAGVKPLEAMHGALKQLGDALLSGGIKAAITGIASGNLVQAGIGGAEAAVGFGISLFEGDREKQKAKRQKQLDDAKAQAEEAARKAEEINQAISTYLQRITAAAFAGQADTLENRLAQFDAKAQSERLDAISKGGAAIGLLEQALGMERANIVTDWNKKIADDEKTAMEQRQAAIDAILQRQQSAQDRIFAAGIDTSTLAGKMAALERQFAQERYDEAKAGGEAMGDLLAAQDAERLKLLKDSSDEWLRTQKAAFDDAKSFLDGALRSIKQFLDGLTAGSGSPLSPAARLAAAASQFSTQLALAQGGDRDALSGITGYASTYLDAAKAQYASSSGYQTIFGQVQDQLGALPSQVSPEQFIVNAIDKQTDDLSQVFDSIDINADGLISRQEASNTFLASIFNELDVNGDGMLQKSELIRLNTGNTAISTGSIDGYTQGVLTYTASVNSFNATMVGIQGTMSSQLSTQIAQLSTAVTQLILMSKVVWNTAQLVTYTTNGFGSPQYARGGYIAGPGSDTSDSIDARLSNGEFVMRAAAVRSLGVPLLDRLNRGEPIRLPSLPVVQGGGSDAAELRELRRTVKEMADRLAFLMADGNERVANRVGEVRDHVKAGNEDRRKNLRDAPGARIGRG